MRFGNRQLSSIAVYVCCDLAKLKSQSAAIRILFTSPDLEMSYQQNKNTLSLSIVCDVRRRSSSSSSAAWQFFPSVSDGSDGALAAAQPAANYIHPRRERARLPAVAATGSVCALFATGLSFSITCNYHHIIEPVDHIYSWKKCALAS